MAWNISNSTPIYGLDHIRDTYSQLSDPAVNSYYLIVVPILTFICFLAVLGNVYILACLRWIRTSGMTVNLILTLGLCGADAWAAVLVLLGLSLNTYLPMVYGFTMGKWSQCYFLLLELVRLSGMITSNMHLLALALNHWFSIVSPLRYKTAVTTGWCRLIMFLLWILPLLIMVIATGCIPGQGFRGGGEVWCNVDFYFQFPFRIVIFVQFILPLLTMLGIYGYILHRLSEVRDAKRDHNDNTRRSLMLNEHRSNAQNGSIGQSKWSKRKSKPEMRVNTRSNVPQSKIKALITTLLILGTFALGWVPAVTLFMLVCLDGCPITYDRTNRTFFVVGVIVNCLMILKLLINPLIYAFRILEIRYAIWHMHVTRYGWRSIPIQVHVPEEFRNLDCRRRTVRTTKTSH